LAHCREAEVGHDRQRWKEGGTTKEINFDFGCSSQAARQLLSQINEADDLVGAEWKLAAPLSSEAKP
jgi:hypothetical protein